MTEEEFYIHLGNRIKFLREKSHLTQEKLAEKSGISLDYLGKIEVSINTVGFSECKSKKPGLKTIFKLAQALSCDVKDLFDF